MTRPPGWVIREPAYHAPQDAVRRTGRDIEDQEPPDRIWSSRQHALITCENASLRIEDLNSANGTYVNRNRVLPGQQLELKANDVIQIGTVQLQVRY
jgi:pSer/pThr/pTyr-binding forkhead associated (FHA) protein